MKIETRDHLLSTLAEASELEHHLMCLYLYAAFSLKRSTAEGITPAELDAITTWRTEILAIAGQEMTHLALVTNLTTAIGGSAHLFRAGFPAKAGYFPSDFMIELAPFSLATLDHFIFLERPEDREVQEGQDFQPAHDYTRDAPHGRLMDYAGEYETVGQLYCLVPLCDGVVYAALSTKEALWDKYYTGAPARLRQCVGQSNIVKRA